MKLTENYKPVISMCTAADILRMTKPRLQAAAERGELPFAIETTLPGEEKRSFKVITGRLEKYMDGEDMQYEN